MAVSSPAIPNVHVVTRPNSSLYHKLNGKWHKISLLILTAVVLGHWSEHLVQAYQVFILHWPRPKALGIVGLWYPWLIQSEWLHYGFVTFMLIGLLVLRKGFTGRSRIWWNAAIWIGIWHDIEHTGLLYQALTHHYWFHSPVPCSIVQVWVPRIELHLIYNTIVTIPMAMGMYYHMFPPEGEEQPHQDCTCEWHPAEERSSAAA
ncbi:MAG TPA: hypothetical protein VGG46_14070 [Terriglobales bacterium]|jgi:hypothetical protein